MSDRVRFMVEVLVDWMNEWVIVGFMGRSVSRLIEWLIELYLWMEVLVIKCMSDRVGFMVEALVDWMNEW